MIILSPLRFVSATVKNRVPLFVLYFPFMMFDACFRCHFFKRDLFNLYELWTSIWCFARFCPGCLQNFHLCKYVVCFLQVNFLLIVDEGDEF